MVSRRRCWCALSRVCHSTPSPVAKSRYPPPPFSPPSTKEASPLSKKGEYTKIVVIGDTGCRLDTSGTPAVYQACNDSNAWPVAKIAANAAATAPDLIVMTGDYHYRETPCAPGNSGCAGSPWSFNWDVWYADLFSQVQSAFNAAPMFFIRGNHETCDRAGDGWFRYLDPQPYPAMCQAYTDPFAAMADLCN